MVPGNRTAVFVERDAVVGRALRRWAAAEGFDLVGVARQAPEGVALATRLRPRLVMVDLSVPGMEAAEVTLDGLRAASPGLHLVAFSGPEYRIPALDLPVDDFVARPYGLGRMPEEHVVEALTSRLRYVGERVPRADAATG